MDGSEGVGARFSRALDEREARGSTVLLTGHASEATRDRARSGLLGRLPDRVRVLATLDGDVGAARRRLRRAGGGVDPAIVVDGRAQGVRSAAAEPANFGGLDVRFAGASADALDAELADAVGERVVDRGGMAHVCVRGDGDGELSRAVRPARDVVVELRRTNGRPEQRWLLPECDTSTRWTEI